MRHALSGSDGVRVSALFSRSPSQLNMKNSLFRPSTIFGSTTGPLTVNPYWLRLNGGIGRSCRSKKFLASSEEWRANSKIVPRSLFEAKVRVLPNTACCTSVSVLLPMFGIGNGS